MVDEILRILDKSALFTVLFLLVDIVKTFFACLILYFYENDLKNSEKSLWLSLVLFVVENILEMAYFLTKFLQIIFKQRKIIRLFFTGKEINFNPYDQTRQDKIFECIYYTIMT